MSDQLVATLANFGYQAIFLPGTGYIPPDLYTYRGGSGKIPTRLVRHGPLSSYLDGSERDQFDLNQRKVSTIKGVYTSSKNSGGSLDFLSRSLACIGIPALPKARIGIDLGKAIVFSFDGVTSKAIDPAEIEKVLGRLILKGRIPSDQIEDGDVHVAYEYLYAKQLVMARADGGTFTGDVAGKIGDWVNLGSAKVNVKVRRQTTISFEVTGSGEAPAFAYKAGQIVPSDDGFSLRVEVVKAGGIRGGQAPYVPHPDHPLKVMNKIRREGGQPKVQ
jgi:hypothetical protein